jgi:hypothetical protein
MQSIPLGDYGGSIMFTQDLDISTANVYVLYTKPDGTKGQWDTVKSGTSFYYTIEDGDLDQTGKWILRPIARWSNKLTWSKRSVSFRVKNAPISRIPAISSPSTSPSSSPSAS